MKYVFLAAIFFVIGLSATTAKALDINFGVAGNGFAISGPGGTTIVAPLGSAETKIINVGPMTDDQRARDAQWIEKCKPAFVIGEYGVTYYDFSKSPANCEYGVVPQ